MMMMIAICPKGQQKGCEGAVQSNLHSGCSVEEEWREPEQWGQSRQEVPAITQETLCKVTAGWVRAQG